MISNKRLNYCRGTMWHSMSLEDSVKLILGYLEANNDVNGTYHNQFAHHVWGAQLQCFILKLTLHWSCPFWQYLYLQRSICILKLKWLASLIAKTVRSSQTVKRSRDPGHAPPPPPSERDRWTQATALFCTSTAMCGKKNNDKVELTTAYGFTLSTMEIIIPKTANSNSRHPDTITSRLAATTISVPSTALTNSTWVMCRWMNTAATAAANSYKCTRHIIIFTANSTTVHNATISWHGSVITFIHYNKHETKYI